MCLPIVLAIVLAPLFGGAIGYANHGATGAWIGALAGLALGLVVAVGPFALLANAARKKLERERQLHPEDRVE